MKKIKILLSFLLNPKEIISLGYQAKTKKDNTIDYNAYISKKYNKTQLSTIDILSLFPDFDEFLNCYSFLTDTSLVTDIALLKALAKNNNNCSYLEIGSLRGESICEVASVAKDCTSITLSDDEMKAFNFKEGYIKNHGIFIKNIPNIITHRHNSQTFDFNSLNKKFDLIFVDGDHSYNGVLIDTKNVFKLLKNEQSIIVWHDYGHNVEQVREEVLAGILDGTPTEYHKNLYHVSNTMCAIFIRGKFDTTITELLTLPNKVFEINIKAKTFKDEIKHT